MQDPLQIPLMKLARAVIALKPVLIDAIGVEALHFADDNFRNQGFAGAPWKERQQPNKPRPHKILILTGALRRDGKQHNGPDAATITYSLPYARVHNEGGEIRHPSRSVILNFRHVKPIDFEIHGKYATRFSKQNRATFSQKATIGEHTTHMPQRQFIGKSPVLTQRCEGVLIKKVTKALK